MTMTERIAVHPERTADPATLRWYLGRSLADHPDVLRALDPLLAQGVLREATIEPLAVRTTLAAGRSWAVDAAAVRAAVQDAVRAHRRHVAELGDAGRAALVQRLTSEVLTELIGPLALGHGGAVELAGVRPGPVIEVCVRLRGACHGCPAAGSTLHGRLEAELRRRLPDVDLRVSAAAG
jgi:Fe-S cluster biogenesis protein NfuA